MSVPEVQLDDRRFQALLDEARQRITQTCPTWNEHNVSDPGITLIELFAWMTELLIYRVNRIPEKVERALLALLAVDREPAVAATVPLRFRLGAPARRRISLPGHSVEVATAAAAGTPVVFRLAETVSIPPLALARMTLGRAGDLRPVPVRAGVASPTGSARAAFSTPPDADDSIYLGFVSSLAGLVVAVDVKAARARGAGIDPNRPPWVWEVATGAGTWAQAEVLRDETGGFNYGSGTIELQMPAVAEPETIGDDRMHWLRCRVAPPDGPGAAPAYTHPPALEAVSAGAIGILAPAEHADVAEDEIVGTSDGTPGQAYPLANRPVLALDDGDALEVRDPEEGWLEWDPQDGFGESSDTDRHYVFDPVAGEVQFGPAIRHRDEGWTQHGAIPPAGAQVRMRRYHHGGGAGGNVAAGTLTVLRRPIPEVASVVNPVAAHGGVDAESLAALRRRAATEIRTQYRGVTARDFETLARHASRQVARARCTQPAPGGAIPVLILPDVPKPAARHDFDALQPSDALLAQVGKYLDARRVLGTSVHVSGVTLRGVTVVTHVEVGAGTDTAKVEKLVRQTLERYLNPYVGGSLTGAGPGWEFGRAVRVSDLEVGVRGVPGVRLVSLLRVYETELATDTPSPQPIVDQLQIGPDELVASGRHLVRASVLPRA